MGDTSNLLMPKLGLTMTEGTITEWRVQPGESFTAGQIVAVVETEKIANEVEAPGAGTMEEHLVGSGATVAVGTQIARWKLDDGTPPQTPEKAAPPDEPPQEATAPPAAQTERPQAPPEKRPPRKAGERIVATPLARRIARESDIDLTQVTGTGPGGRIKAADVSKAVPSESPTLSAVSTAPGTTFFLTAQVNGGASIKLLKELAELDGPGIFRPVHLVCLAAAKAADNFFETASTENIGLISTDQAEPQVTVLRGAASMTLRDIASAIASGMGGEAASIAIAVAETGADGLTQMSVPLPQGAVASLGIGTPQDVFRPDAAGQPDLCREFTVIMTCDQRATDMASATKFLKALKTHLEHPLRLLAG